MRRDHEQALRAFEAHARRRNLAPPTIRYRLQVARRFLPLLGRRPVASATTRDVRRYLAVRAPRIRSVRHELSALRAFFAAVLPEARPLPTDRVTTKLLQPRPPVVLSTGGVATLLTTALDAEGRGRGFKAKRQAFALRDRALLELLYGVGVRCAEAAAVKVVDLDLDAGTLLVRRAKRGTSRVVPLPPASVPHLRRYLDDGRPVLLHPTNDPCGALLLSLRGKPLGTPSIYGLVKKLARIAGVRAHPHAFRRALATHLVHEGASVPAVKELLGHAYLSTTAAYVAIDFEDLRRAVEKLDTRDR